MTRSDETSLKSHFGYSEMRIFLKTAVYADYFGIWI